MYNQESNLLFILLLFFRGWGLGQKDGEIKSKNSDIAV